MGPPKASTAQVASWVQYEPGSQSVSWPHGEWIMPPEHSPVDESQVEPRTHAPALSTQPAMQRPSGPHTVDGGAHSESAAQLKLPTSAVRRQPASASSASAKISR